MIWLGLTAAGYLLGSVPFSYLIARRSTGMDVRAVGSGNAGATNVLRTAGLAPAIGALLADAGKGAAAVGLALACKAPLALAGAAGVAAVVGHVYPVFLGFRGGKGVATAAGALAVLAPLPALALVAVFLLVLATTRYVSLASVGSALALPAVTYLAVPQSWSTDSGRALLASTGLVALLVVWKHRSNFRRIREGSEPRVDREAFGREIS